MAPTVQIFVDEARRAEYMLVAAVVASGDLTESRKAMREIKPRNCNRIHMHSEGKNSRAKIISEFVKRRPIEIAHIFVADPARRPERDVRDQLLGVLGSMSVELGASRILVESCSQDKQDRAALTNALAGLNALGQVRVDVDTPTSNEMLWAADIIAWAYGVGGGARQQIRHLIEVHTIE